MAFFRTVTHKREGDRVYQYVHLCENSTVDGKQTQNVLVNLGPLAELPKLVYMLSQFVGVEKFLAWAADHPHLRIVCLAFPRLSDDVRNQICDIIRADLARAKASAAPEAHAEPAPEAELLHE